MVSPLALVIVLAPTPKPTAPADPPTDPLASWRWLGTADERVLWAILGAAALLFIWGVWSAARAARRPKP